MLITMFSLLCVTFMSSILQCMLKYVNEGLREDHLLA